jgi:GMP synthase (glutamine-hydrolysing)
VKKELVIVIDFGGQYNQLVARRVRECNVYCEIYSYKTDIEKIKAMNPKGIILTGGPNSCYEADSPTYKKELFELGIPVLGLCYGAQLMMHVLGGKVESAPVREYGKTEVLVDKKDSKIFEGVSEKTICWMSHFDYISQVAPGFEITAHTADCPVAATNLSSSFQRSSHSSLYTFSSIFWFKRHWRISENIMIRVLHWKRLQKSYM